MAAAPRQRWLFPPLGAGSDVTAATVPARAAKNGARAVRGMGGRERLRGLRALPGPPLTSSATPRVPISHHTPFLGSPRSPQRHSLRACWAAPCQRPLRPRRRLTWTG